MLNYFGTRQKKRDTGIPVFGAISSHKGKYGIGWVTEKDSHFGETEDPRKIWDVITDAGTPYLWYAEDLCGLTNELILGTITEEWLRERVPAKHNPKGIEKVKILSAGATRILQVVIREEKKRPVSEKKSTIILRDIKNYWAEGLPSLSEGFNLKSIRDIESRTAAVLLGMNNIYTFFKDNFNEVLGLSLGSTVMLALQRSLEDTKIPRLTPLAEELIKPGFYGGNAEVYRILTEHSYMYDKNGLYAEAYMNPLPVKNGYIDYDMTPEELMANEDLGFAKVDAYVPEDLPEGKLPVHTSTGSVRPVGLIEGQTYFTPVLKGAVLSHGVVIRKVYHTVLFETSYAFLAPWAILTGRLKEEAANKGERYLARMCQNLPYGKFAQKETRLEMHLGAAPPEKRDLPTVTIISDDLPIWFEEVTRPVAHHLLHIAAAITGWSVVIMDREFEKMRSYGLEPSYTDTDSAIINGALPPEIVGDALGQWKIEHEDKTAVCFAPKCYAILDGDNIEDSRFKGLPDYTPTKEDMEALMAGKSISTPWNQPKGLIQALVEKFRYQKYPGMFTNVLECKESTRQFPGKDRNLNSVLDFDTKRKQLSLYHSRPLTVEEACKLR